MENTNQITKKFNPAHAQAIMELLAKSPFYDLIDMDMVAIEPGYARVDLEVTKRHHNPFGQIHGPPTGPSMPMHRSMKVMSRSTCW